MQPSRKRTGNYGKRTGELDRTSSGRPKRKCTVNAAKIVADDHEEAVSDDDYIPEEPPEQPKVTAQPSVQRSAPSNSNTSNNASDVKEAMATVGPIYKWIEYDSDTRKVRCKICIAANLKKWFIVAGANVSTLNDSLLLHEGSEEHKRSVGGKGVAASSTQNSSNRHIPSLAAISENSDNLDSTLRNVYCIPMPCIDPVPIPKPQLRKLLEKYGLVTKVDFAAELSPARLREDISKAFAKTFSLRAQELLQFDYLTPTEDKKELTKPKKMLHFDSKTILSFSGDDDIFILLKQKAPSQTVNWQQLLFQEDHLKSLGDEEYREVMLNVMHRLSSGKHKKDATPDQQQLIESLIDDYMLNSYHQLVFTGHGLSQLVLFTEKRRLETFLSAHSANHKNLQKTFTNVFRKFYWNGMEEWVTKQFKSCTGCLERYGAEMVMSQEISVTQIKEDFSPYSGRKSKNQSNSTSAAETTACEADESMDTAPSDDQQQIQVKQEPIDEDISIDSGKDIMLPFIKKENELLPPPVDVTSFEREPRAAMDSSDSSYCASSLWSMYLLQQKELFCDFYITVLPSASNGLKEARPYSVHRIVFAAISKRIREIPKTTIKIGGKVTPKSLEAVIEYAYTGKFNGVKTLPLRSILQISNTAMALDIKIDQYLQKERQDFTKSSAKILVTRNPSEEAS